MQFSRVGSFKLGSDFAFGSYSGKLRKCIQRHYWRNLVITIF